MKRIYWFLQDKNRIIKEKVKFFIIWRLPRWVVYMCTVRIFANASSGKYSNQDPSMLTYNEVMTRWMNKEGGDRSNGKK